MKTYWLFRTRIRDRHLDWMILVIRLAVGVMMITHGLPKLNKLLEGGEISFADPIGLGSTLSLILAVFAEFVCSLFLILGLGTRLAALPLAFTMAVAAFIVHGPDPFGDKEMALLYLVFYLLLMVSGSGRFSVDRLISRGKR